MCFKQFAVYEEDYRHQRHGSHQADDKFVSSERACDLIRGRASLPDMPSQFAGLVNPPSKRLPLSPQIPGHPPSPFLRLSQLKLVLQGVCRVGKGSLGESVLEGLGGIGIVIARGRGGEERGFWVGVGFEGLEELTVSVDVPLEG